MGCRFLLCAAIIAQPDAKVKTLISQIWNNHSLLHLMVELTGSANYCHIGSPLAYWPCHHSPGGTTMWQICFAVFAIPTAVITALALVEILVYGGER